MSGAHGPKRVITGRMYTPWQIRMSLPERASRDKAWLTAARFPR